MSEKTEKANSLQRRVHREAMAAFWHHDGKLAQPGEGGGACPPSFPVCHISGIIKRGEILTKMITKNDNIK
jgi:hypothetical protein